MAWATARIAIIVEITNGDSLPIVPFPAKTGLLGDVGKRSIAVVVVKSATQGMRGL